MRKNKEVGTMRKQYCHNCQREHTIKEVKEFREYTIKGTKVSGEITILRCENCGEEIYNKENEINNDRILFDDYKRKNNLLTSQEIKAMRENYGLSQSILAKLLGFGEKTITRYENGAIQDKTHDLLMRLASVESNFLQLWETNKNNFSSYENNKIKKTITLPEAQVFDYKPDSINTVTYNTKIENGGVYCERC
ncbi:MAG: type II toxin-antitoxin system MqsA family antitoxin [Acholeplasmataceae bacterium]|nr:type II toxin-antitoxin system MqsA family antitoxin [Acholeplasmataceae bacterium]